ncbi:hypothetical protein PR202_ga21300 [Eleusine coracana subsp. coracana]|uniref:RRM domain-containing protein n=1 Tax=Eleusine coracana subsp. coracana TaxID=191504 RepID=A0AAV5D124_ELECO|nr:hypothetical protein PR202_ga21300 [Eleusine coracana subsp. coracana]
MALPFARLLLPTLSACQCQPQAPPRLSFSTRRSQASFIIPTTACSPGNRAGACAASASVTAAPAPEAEVGEPVGPRTRLVAQNIPWDCTADDMRALFEKHGTVVDVEVIVSSLSMYNSSKNRGLAFVTMGSEEEALLVHSNLHSTKLMGRPINVMFKDDNAKKNKSSVTMEEAEVELPEQNDS